MGNSSSGIHEFNLARFLYKYIGMNVAIPIWNDRISPVFDTARKILVVRIDNGKETQRIEANLVESDFYARAHSLQQLQIQTLICGAISKPLELELISRGIQVISHVCGEAEDVLEAFLSGDITQDRFTMPGCCHKRRFQHRHHHAMCSKKGNQH